MYLISIDYVIMIIDIVTQHNTTQVNIPNIKFQYIEPPNLGEVHVYQTESRDQGNRGNFSDERKILEITNIDEKIYKTLLI